MSPKMPEFHLEEEETNKTPKVQHPGALEAMRKPKKPSSVLEAKLERYRFMQKEAGELKAQMEAIRHLLIDRLSYGSHEFACAKVFIQARENITLDREALAKAHPDIDLSQFEKRTRYDNADVRFKSIDKSEPKPPRTSRPKPPKVVLAKADVPEVKPPKQQLPPFASVQDWEAERQDSNMDE